MRSVAFPEAVDVTPGNEGFISVAITNNSSVIDAYRVQVFGLDPEWVRVEPERLSLFPGQTESVDIHVSLPVDYPASHRTLSVNVSSDDDPAAFSLNEVALAVQPRTRTSIRLDPVMITGGRSARFGMIVANVGNAPVTATGFAVDPEELADFRFHPVGVVVPPGREQVIEVTASGGRTWFGQPRARTFTFGVDAEERIETLGTFVQRPRIPRWLISLLGLLTAAAVFAAVLSRTFDSVVQEARVSDAVLDAALERDAAGGAVVPVNPGSVGGRLISATTQAGLSGAQAELFVADDTETPVSSAATDDTGGFRFANLGAGTYKLKITGAGINDTWYNDAATEADAAEITVVLDELTELGDITIAGTPVNVSGAIAVDNPAGTTVSLVVPGQTGSGAAPVVAEVPLAPDGSFTLPNVPSPGVYQLIVTSPGSPPQVRDLVLEPGRPVPEIEMAVQAGTGLISGSVSGPFGALGGATVTASDGTNEIETVSLTEGSLGTYTLRNLATPNQYTVVISRDGFSSESRTISLTNEQPTGAFDARLLPATGSISGRSLIGGAPARGLQVSVTGGEVNRTAGVISQGPAAGSYAFNALPAPGTYTLTFSGQGTIPQVRVIDLDPGSGTQDAGGVDVSLSLEDTSVGGVIRGIDGQPVAQANVTLSDGADNRTVLTADEPRGIFRFSGVPPGAYTLTASRTGTEPVVVLVNVSAGAVIAPLDLQLGAQASIRGNVTGFDTATRSLPVRLFLPEQFPRGIPLAETTTDANGQFEFTSLAAPQNFVVAIYAGDTAADPLDSSSIATAPGQPVTIPPFTVSLS